MQNLYFTLISSLPALPHFERATRLPINRPRLEQRLNMLEQEDFRVAKLTQEFLFWQYHPLERSNAEFAQHYQHILSVVSQPTLLDIIHYRMDVRTITAALRRRHFNHSPPLPNETWGVGQWVRHIENHWQVADFSLASIHPWISEAICLLDEEESLALEKLLLGQIWRYLERHVQEGIFTLDTVLIYLFKWDIINRWLINNPEISAEQFEELIRQALNS